MPKAVLIHIVRILNKRVFGPKNMVCASILSESHHVVQWILIIKYFGFNIQYIFGVNNIFHDKLIKVATATNNRALRFVNKTFLLEEMNPKHLVSPQNYC